jgi:DNA-binding Lrp family transcriptional regulator
MLFVSSILVWSGGPSAIVYIQRMKLDRSDVAILRALRQDARMSLADIASRVGLTSSPCWTRMRRLEAGVIEGYAAVA